MKVAELIAILQKLPQDAIVVSSWDDEPFASPINGAAWSGDEQDGRMIDDGNEAVHFVDLDIGRPETFEILTGDWEEE